MVNLYPTYNNHVWSCSGSFCRMKFHYMQQHLLFDWGLDLLGVGLMNATVLLSIIGNSFCIISTISSKIKSRCLLFQMIYCKSFMSNISWQLFHFTYLFIFRRYFTRCIWTLWVTIIVNRTVNWPDILTYSTQPIKCPSRAVRISFAVKIRKDEPPSRKNSQWRSVIFQAVDYSLQVMPCGHHIVRMQLESMTINDLRNAVVRLCRKKGEAPTFERLMRLRFFSVTWKTDIRKCWTSNLFKAVVDKLTDLLFVWTSELVKQRGGGSWSSHISESQQGVAASFIWPAGCYWLLIWLVAAFNNRHQFQVHNAPGRQIGEQRIRG